MDFPGEIRERCGGAFRRGLSVYGFVVSGGLFFLGKMQAETKQ